LREELYITAFSKEDSETMALQNDPEIQKAIEALPSSKALLDKAHEVIAHQGSKKPAVAEVR